MQFFNNKPKVNDYKIKNKKDYLIYSIIAIIILAFIFLQIQENLDYYRFNIVKHIMQKKHKSEIFSYLKSVQPIEDEFYALLSKRLKYLGDKSKEEYLEFLHNSIIVIDSQILKLLDSKASSQSMENKIFFLEEMKLLKNTFMEEAYGLKYGDSDSLEKSKGYYEQYLITAKQRKESLKKLFDNYEILYIDLGNRIKYKTE